MKDPEIPKGRSVLPTSLLGVVPGLPPKSPTGGPGKTSGLAAGKNGLTVNGIAEGSTVSFNTIAAKTPGYWHAPCDSKCGMNQPRLSPNKGNHQVDGLRQRYLAPSGMPGAQLLLDVVLVLVLFGNGMEQDPLLEVVFLF